MRSLGSRRTRRAVGGLGRTNSRSRVSLHCIAIIASRPPPFAPPNPVFPCATKSGVVSPPDESVGSANAAWFKAGPQFVAGVQDPEVHRAVLFGKARLGMTHPGVVVRRNARPAHPHALSIAIETPTKVRGGCSRMTRPLNPHHVAPLHDRFCEPV